jgi:hypothetical protein
MIWRTATAKDEPVVHRPLAIDDHMPQLAERLGVSQTDLVPERLRQGCRGHHERVDGRHGSAVTGQPGGPCLGGPDDVAGLDDDPVLGQHPTGAQPGDLSVLADPSSPSLDCLGKSHR